MIGGGKHLFSHWRPDCVVARNNGWIRDRKIPGLKDYIYTCVAPGQNLLPFHPGLTGKRHSKATVAVAHVKFPVSFFKNPFSSHSVDKTHFMPSSFSSASFLSSSLSASFSFSSFSLSSWLPRCTCCCCCCWPCCCRKEASNSARECKDGTKKEKQRHNEQNFIFLHHNGTTRRADLSGSLLKHKSQLQENGLNTSLRTEVKGLREFCGHV